jgi:hypothetical protein
VIVFGAKETTHTRIDAELGLPSDPVTQAVFDFVADAMKR